MIQANELRIGNWVYHIELCENVQVESISSDQVTIKDHVVWDGDIGLIVDIPLTEEILLKCGFLKDKDRDSYYLDIEHGYNRFDLMFFNKDVYLKSRYTAENLDVQKIPHIKYLHQLQNIVHALTNNEIKINLHSK